MPWAVRKGAGSCGSNSWAVINATTGRVAGCHPSKTAANKQLAALNANVTEGTMPTATRLRVVESRPFAEAATPAEGNGRLLVRLITPGWGASGYYAPEVLEAAARDRVFSAGTLMFADHPTATEAEERPERSITDLAAVLTEDARWDGAGLVSEARVFSAWRQPLSDMAETIGVSIRAFAEGEPGEAEGRRGRIITQLTEATSVDFVTRAGRGGEFEVLEAERIAEARNVGQWVESRIHRDFSVLADEMFGDGRLTREERIALSGAIGDALASFTSRVEADAPGLYERDIWEDPTPAAVAEESADATEITDEAAESADTPDEGATDPAAESAETAAEAESTNSSVEESNMTDSTGAGGSAPNRTPRQLYEAQIAEERAENARLRARDHARDIVNEVLADAIISESARQRVYAQSLVDLPMVNGTLDEAALRDRVTEARDAAETEYAETLHAHGIGAPRGLGHTAVPAAEASKYDERLGDSLKRLGLSDEATAVAVRGR